MAKVTRVPPEPQQTDVQVTLSQEEAQCLLFALFYPGSYGKLPVRIRYDEGNEPLVRALQKAGVAVQKDNMLRPVWPGRPEHRA